jgi:uncharacterized protein DUF4262
MSRLERSAMLERIKENIQRFGFHIYFIQGGVVPRFAYTIGLGPSLGAELVLGGLICYMLDDIKRIVHTIRDQLAAGAGADSIFVVPDAGQFTLRKAHRSWTGLLMLGALDYYATSEVEAYQIVPDALHETIDTPDMGQEWSAKVEPAWQWLREPWRYGVSQTSTAITNLDALRGDRITEVTRWEQDEWEMFAGAGPDVPPDDVRIVPIGSMLAADPSLAPILDLEIGEGLWRENGDGDWNPWSSSSDESSDPSC